MEQLAPSRMFFIVRKQEQLYKHLLTTKLFIMNKRFFTLMAAVMLAGSPFAANYAFALGAPVVLADEEDASLVEFVPYGEDNAGAKLANGVKFIVKSADNKYVTVESVKVKNGTFMEQKATLTETNPEKAAQFEIRNFTKNALGVTFTLYVDGKQFAYGGGDNADASLTFTAAGEKLGNVTAINIAKIGGDNSDIFGQVSNGFALGTIKKTYDADAFAEYNKNSVTLGFDATNLEGNVFEGVKALDLTINGIEGTYFVKGAAKDITAFLDDQVKDKAAKLSFVYVKNEQYVINALVAGEGYKIVLINGAELYKDEPVPANNAAFQTIVENDQLNNEGSLVLTINPVVGEGAEDPTEGLRVVAIKPSATDTKTYVTTYNPDGSTFTPIYPTLGGNTYFAASEFLKKGAMSAYNIYFTSNEASKQYVSSTEYHKYLAVNCHDDLEDEDNPATPLVALAKNNIDLTTPYAQWVVTDFDGKYTVTLQNRISDETLSLKLQATDNAGVYDVVAGEGEVNVGALGEDVALSDTQIKLIPITTGKTDGFMVLSDETLEAGVKLAFTGKDAQLGAQTYYAKRTSYTDPYEELRYRLIPVLDEKDATKLDVVAYEPAADAEEDEDFIQVIEYACLDAAGKMTSAKDTLVVPAYQFTYSYLANPNDEELTTEYVTYGLRLDQNESNADIYVIVKGLNGKYVLADVLADSYGSAIGVWHNYFVTYGEVCSLDNSAFAYVDVIVNDNSDKTTLPAVSRHATLENPLGSVSFQQNQNGILEGILSAAPMTFWLDTADSEKATPFFYISKGIAAAEEETPETKAYDGGVRNFLYMAKDSATIFDEGNAVEKTNWDYILDGTTNYKAIFRPANLVAEDTLTTVVDGKEVKVTGDAVKNFQFGICLADEDVEGEYVVYSKATNEYLYSLNGKLGFTPNDYEAMVFTLGEGDPTANEAIAAEAGVQVIGGQGVVTVQGAAGKVITVANILGQTIANQVAASDNVTIAAPAGVVVVSVDGEATKVIVK